jgi:hypothetical protein
MAMIRPKPILKNLSSRRHHPRTILQDKGNLEEEVRKVFGEKAPDRFRAYELQITAPFYEGSELRFEEIDDFKKLGAPDGPEKIGKVYQIVMKDIKSIQVKGADVLLDLQFERFSVILDLNPENEEMRYMKLLFTYS